MEENELDQSEAIRKWWKENGMAVFTGVLLGLALLFGWRGWKAYEASQQETASILYSQSVSSFERGNAIKARELASQLLSEYNTSAYAIQITFRLAQQEVQDNNYDAAHAHLDWIIKQNNTAEFTNTARLRKARLLIAEKKLDELKTLLALVEGKEGTFKMGFAEVRGDMAVLEGRKNDARKAYEEVLSLSELMEDGLSFEHKELVEMKLNNLGLPNSEKIIAPPPPTTVAEDTTKSTDKIVESTPEVAETSESTAETTEIVEPTPEVAETSESTVETTEIVEPTPEVAETSESTAETTEIVEPTPEVAETNESTAETTEIVEPTPEVAETSESTAEDELETSIKILSEELEKSLDPTTGTISASELDKLAPTLSKIAEKLTATPSTTTEIQVPAKP
jgi:predicted negative regulator of RcsB-dependent stress response